MNHPPPPVRCPKCGSMHGLQRCPACGAPRPAAILLHPAMSHSQALDVCRRIGGRVEVDKGYNYSVIPEEAA